MNRILVTTFAQLDKIANLEEILPNEYAVVNQWKAKGILEHLFLKGDGAILVFKDIDDTKVKELIPTLPLFSHFDKVEYLSIEKQF